MSSWRTISGGGGIALALASCSLLTSIPELTGGHEDVPASSDSGVASADGGGTDAAVVGDAKPFCRSLTPPPMFCDDFDEDLQLTPRWKTRGTVSIDESLALSLPGSLFSTMAQGPGSCRYAVAEKSIAGAFRASRLAFSVRFGEKSEFDGPSVIAAQYFDIPSGGNDVRCQVYVSLDPRNPSVYEQIVTGFPDGGNTQIEQQHSFQRSLAPNEWHRIVIDYDLGARTLVASIDGGTVVNDPLKHTCPSGAAPASAQLGFFCVNETPTTLRVRFDDVTFDAR